jgi:hypothetical protein
VSHARGITNVVFCFGSSELTSMGSVSRHLNYVSMWLLKECSDEECFGLKMIATWAVGDFEEK